MPFTPAYIFTLLLGIWVISLVGCIALGICCYRLVADRRRLRACLKQADMLLTVNQPCRGGQTPGRFALAHAAGFGT